MMNFLNSLVSPGLIQLNIVHIHNWATGCGSNRQLKLCSTKFVLCLQGRLCITNNSTAFNDGSASVSNKMSGYHLANA